MSNLTRAKCPVCCRDLLLDTDSRFTFCKYCGSKFNVIAAVAFHRASNGEGIGNVAPDFSITDGKLESFHGNDARVEIPSNVTAIGERAFQNRTAMETVVIPDSVKVIEDGAFLGCTALTSVVIPHGVESIGNYAFSGCTRLSSVSLPDSVTSIGDIAFSGCTSLVSVAIPDSVTSIGSGAFSGCSAMLSVSIPDRVTVIRRGTFRDCSNLLSAELCDGLEDIEREAFLGCGKLLRVYVRKRTKQVDDCYVMPPKMNRIRNHVFSHVPRVLVFLCADRIIVNWKSTGSYRYSFFASNGSVSVFHKMHRFPLLFWKSGDEFVKNEQIGEVFCERGDVRFEDGRSDEQKRQSDVGIPNSWFTDNHGDNIQG